MKENVRSSLMFPKAKFFNLNSNPVFMVCRDGKREVVVFDAHMQIQSSDPFKNSSGVKEVEVDVKSWSAKGSSKLLDCDLEFRLTNLGKNSKVTAKQLNQDFPGQLDFSMEYEVLINGEVVAEGLSGNAQGEINNFPPKTNDVFYVSGKSLTLGSNDEITIDVLACAC